MSFFRKVKRGLETPAKPTICRRCHERTGTTQIHDVALTPASVTPLAAHNLWFCDRCLDEIGRSKPRNS
jgi:hypothetical protein